VAQQLGLALAARAHAEEALLGAVADRQHVVRPGEDVDLADVQLLAGDLHHVQHGEDLAAVFLDLGPLVAVARVLDRELVQVELPAHLLDFQSEASRSATQTKQPGLARYSWISLCAMSASFLPSW
jgi:hypothetical protein